MKPTHTHTRLQARTAIVGAGAILIAALLAAVVFSSTSGARTSGRSANSSDGLAVLQGHFALLRTRATMTPPPALANAVAKAPPSYGLDLADARHAAATNSWLVPGNGWLCIAANDREGLGIACTSSASAEAGELSLAERSQASGEEHIVGACPDSFATVTAIGAGSSHLSTSAVRESTYAMTVRDAVRMTAG
ncbi:MAG TPA: hypothetical protein VMD79_03430 [Solirubrobacteraceae bacterium]|nr:hypothetical protein [Solirubrobacteraceae bacterium]